MHFERKDDILMELTKTAENKTENDAWLSLVERYVRDVEVAGSNPVASIPWQGRVEKSGKIFGFFFYSMRELWEYEVRNNSYGIFWPQHHSVNEKQRLHLFEIKFKQMQLFSVFRSLIKADGHSEHLQPTVILYPSISGKSYFLTLVYSDYLLK